MKVGSRAALGCSSFFVGLEGAAIRPIRPISLICLICLMKSPAVAAGDVLPMSGAAAAVAVIALAATAARAEDGQQADGEEAESRGLGHDIELEAAF